MSEVFIFLAYGTYFNFSVIMKIIISNCASPEYRRFDLFLKDGLLLANLPLAALFFQFAGSTELLFEKSDNLAI